MKKFTVLFFFLMFSVILFSCQEEKNGETIINYTISFFPGYDGADEILPITVEKNKPSGSLWPANPKRNLHTFKGWFTDNNVLYNSATIITGNVTLTARWFNELTGAQEQPADDTVLKGLFEISGGFPAQLSNSWKIWNHRNPLFTQGFGADPNVLVYNDRLYVYMSNDTLEYNSAGEFLTAATDPRANGPSYAFGIQGIRIVSSADLANWTDHGAVNITGPVSTNPLVSNEEWEAGRLINNPSIDRSWAPTAAWKDINGKTHFFLYWCNGGNGVGVVTADSPTGPWRAPFQKLLIDRNTPNCSDVLWLFDPTVFVDDNGQAYLFFGGGWENATPPIPVDNTGMARRVRLTANMTSIIGTPEKWYVPYLFEASDLKKIKGRYYFSYSTHYSLGGNTYGLGSYDIAYMMAEHPLDYFPGGYTPPVTVLTRASNSNQLSSNDSNNHHAMFEFKGGTYITYHTQKVGEAMGTYNRMRSAFIDNMPVNSDGTIPRVQMTRKGVDQVGYLNPYLLNEAETIGIQGGIYTRPVSDAGNGMLVTSIDTGDWIALYGVDFGASGASKFTARVRLPEEADYTGAIQLRLDPAGDGLTGDNDNVTPVNTTRIKGGEVVGYMQVKAAAGMEGNYALITIELERKITGVHNLVFVFYSSRGVHPETILPDSRHKDGFEFDQWQFSQ